MPNVVADNLILPKLKGVKNEEDSSFDIINIILKSPHEQPLL